MRQNRKPASAGAPHLSLTMVIFLVPLAGMLVLWFGGLVVASLTITRLGAYRFPARLGNRVPENIRNMPADGVNPLAISPDLKGQY